MECVRRCYTVNDQGKKGVLEFTKTKRQVQHSGVVSDGQQLWCAKDTTTEKKPKRKTSESTISLQWRC